MVLCLPIGPLCLPGDRLPTIEEALSMAVTKPSAGCMGPLDILSCFGGSRGHPEWTPYGVTGRCGVGRESEFTS